MNKPNLIRSMQLPPLSVQRYERYLPTAFDESLSILEKINRVIHYVGEVDGLTQSMLDKWNEVYEWVMTDGLELGIGDRLNEMVNDGTIEKLINENIFSDLNDKVVDVIEELSITKDELISLNEMTLLEVGRIDDEIKVIDDNIKKILQKPFYQEVTQEKYFDEISGTSYYLTNIPKFDKNGNLIKLKHKVTSKGQIARDVSVEENATVVINASRFDQSEQKLVGLQVVDGEIINSTPYSYSYSLAFDDENKMKAFHPSISVHDILSQGYTNVLTGFHPIIENGVPVSPDIYASANNSSERHPRQVIGQHFSGDLVILTCDGRIGNEQGMTYDDLIRIMRGLGVEFAYNLDGGGSTQTVVRGVLVNNLSDNKGTKERPVFDFLYVAKEENDLDKMRFYNRDIGYLSSKLSQALGLIKNLTDINSGVIRLLGDKGFIYHGIEVFKGDELIGKLTLRAGEIYYWDYKNNRSIFKVLENGDIETPLGKLARIHERPITVSNLNTLVDHSGEYWSQAGSTTNSPDPSISWHIKHIVYNNDNKMQIATPFSTNTDYKQMSRRTVNGLWQSWREI